MDSPSCGSRLPRICLAEECRLCGKSYCHGGGGSNWRRTIRSAVLPEIAGNWKKYSFTLRPAKSDPLAKIAVLFQGKGRLWLDQISLLPGDAQGGFAMTLSNEWRLYIPLLFDGLVET